MNVRASNERFGRENRTLGKRWTPGTLLLCVLLTSGCALVAPLRLPVAFCPARPALVDQIQRLTPDGRAWLEACLNVGRDNCRALQAANQDDLLACEQGLR